LIQPTWSDSSERRKTSAPVWNAPTRALLSVIAVVRMTSQPQRVLSPIWLGGPKRYTPVEPVMSRIVCQLVGWMTTPVGNRKLVVWTSVPALKIASWLASVPRAWVLIPDTLRKPRMFGAVPLPATSSLSSRWRTKSDRRVSR